MKLSTILPLSVAVQLNHASALKARQEVKPPFFLLAGSVLPCIFNTNITNIL
jgi:hypothetical protein